MGLLHRADVEALVAATSPNDGFQVKDVQVGDEHSLHLLFYRNGEAVQPPARAGDILLGEEIWTRKEPLTDKDYGERCRLRLLAQSLCRFLNTGGEWTQLSDALVALWRLVKDSTFVPIPGYHLIDSAVNTEGVYEHVFAAGDSPWAVRWVEKDFIDVVSLVDIRNELREMES